MYKTAILILLIILLIICLTFPEILLDNVIPLFTFLAVSLLFMCSCKGINKNVQNGGADSEFDWEGKLPNDLFNNIVEPYYGVNKILIFDRFYESESAFDDHINQILEENSMRTIPHIKIINNRFINEKQFNALSIVNGLQYITIINCNILTEIPTISNIKSLTILDCDNIEKISTMPNLEKLYIYELEKLNTIEIMPKLNFLHIRSAYVLEKIPLMPELKSFTASECIELTEINMPKLTLLKLDKCFSLTKTTNMPNLTTISIDGKRQTQYNNIELNKKEKEDYYRSLENTKPYLIPENIRISTSQSSRIGYISMQLLNNDIKKKKQNHTNRKYENRRGNYSPKFTGVQAVIENRSDNAFWTEYFDKEQAEKEIYINTKYNIAKETEDYNQKSSADDAARKLKEKEEKEKEEKEKEEKEEKLLLRKEKEKEFHDIWKREIEKNKPDSNKDCSIM